MKEGREKISENFMTTLLTKAVEGSICSYNQGVEVSTIVKRVIP